MKPTTNDASNESVDVNGIPNNDWMNDQTCREAFNRGLIELDKRLSRLSEALDASEQLTEADYAIRVVVPQW